MLLRLAKECRDENIAFCSQKWALLNWFTLSLQTTLRKGEWAQDTQDASKTLRTPDSEPLAKITREFIVYSPHHRKLQLPPTALILVATTVDIVWRYQKI